MKIEFQWERALRAPDVAARRPAAQQMMMHLDIGVGDLDAGVGVGRRRRRHRAGHQPQDGVRVMLDPEGLPFCLFADPYLLRTRGVTPGSPRKPWSDADQVVVARFRAIGPSSVATTMSSSRIPHRPGT